MDERDDILRKYLLETERSTPGEITRENRIVPYALVRIALALEGIREALVRR